MKKTKNWCLAFALGCLCSTAQGEVKHPNHRISYGLLTGVNKQGDFAKDGNYTGVYFRYHYNPANFVNVQVNLDPFTSATLKLKSGNSGSVGSGTMSSGIGETEFLLGYSFSTPSPAVTVIPLIGLHSWLEVNKAKHEANTTEVDILGKFASTELGALGLFNVHPKWELGLAGKVFFTRRGSLETTVSMPATGANTGLKLTNTAEFNKLTYYKIEVPVSFAITDSLGLFSMFEQTFNRTFTTDNAAESKVDLNAWKIRLGMLHRF